MTTTLYPHIIILAITITFLTIIINAVTSRRTNRHTPKTRQASHTDKGSDKGYLQG